jgi:hypothetical protein
VLVIVGLLVLVVALIYWMAIEEVLGTVNDGSNVTGEGGEDHQSMMTTIEK